MTRRKPTHAHTQMSLTHIHMRQTPLFHLSTCYMYHSFKCHVPTCDTQLACMYTHIHSLSHTYICIYALISTRLLGEGGEEGDEEDVAADHRAASGDSFICLTWLDMTHSCVWHDSVMSVTWLSHECDMTQSCVWHDSVMCVTCLVMCVTRLSHVCDLTQSCVWLDSVMCDTTDSCVWHETWLIHACDMTHSCVWYDSWRCSS